MALQLLEHGADATATESGWTPLHQFVWTRRPNRHYNNPAAPDRDNGILTSQSYGIMMMQ